MPNVNRSQGFQELQDEADKRQTEAADAEEAEQSSS